MDISYIHRLHATYIPYIQPLDTNILRKPSLELLSPSVRPQLGLLVGKHNIKTRPQIDLSRWNQPWLLLAHAVDSVAEVNAQENGDANVSCEEATCGPQGWEENIEAVDQSQEGEEDNRCPGSVWLHPGPVRDLVGVCDALEIASLAETEEGDATADPGDETRCVGKVDEPVEDDGTTACDIEVCKRAEERRRCDCHIRNALLCALGEDLWSVAGDCEGEEGARGHVQEGVSR